MNISRLFFLVSVLPLFVFAHTGVGHTHGFANGFAHPIGGLDHLLAMVAVGIWAAQLGGRARLRLPATFVGVMILGGALGFAGIALPAVELGIVVSVLALGVLIAGAFRPAPVLSMAVVGVFAVFHGHAHGAEMPPEAGAALYTLGFALATGLLHGGGILLGIGLRRALHARGVRYAGGALAAAGVWLVAFQ